MGVGGGQGVGVGQGDGGCQLCVGEGIVDHRHTIRSASNDHVGLGLGTHAPAVGVGQDWVRVVGSNALTGPGDLRATGGNLVPKNGGNQGQHREASTPIKPHLAGHISCT
jgi:hypothetical protein